MEPNKTTGDTLAPLIAPRCNCGGGCHDTLYRLDSLASAAFLSSSDSAGLTPKVATRIAANMVIQITCLCFIFPGCPGILLTLINHIYSSAAQPHLLLQFGCK